MNKSPSFKEAFFVFLQVAAYSFGGPANQIAVMHRLLVDEKQWIDEKQFLNALNYCMLLPGPEAHQLIILFSKTAILSFGGAYAVLSYIAQQAVQTYGWLKPVEMLDGLGMAETTPGPLIQVVQFVGFLAAYRYAGDMSPMLAGILGSIITIWVTFTPSFLWIFIGAPYIERLRKIQALHVILTAITAAIVGVILNLSLWFAINTLFGKVEKVQLFILDTYQPIWSTFDYGSAFIMLITLILAFRYKAGIFLILMTGILFGTIINSIF